MVGDRVEMFAEHVRCTAPSILPAAALPFASGIGRTRKTLPTRQGNVRILAVEVYRKTMISSCAFRSLTG